MAALVDGGMSRRGAAKGFGIAPATAIKWVSAWRRRAKVLLALMDEVWRFFRCEHGFQKVQDQVMLMAESYE